MSKVVVLCPDCHADYNVDAALLGRRAQCKRCLATFTLAAAASANDTRTFLPDALPMTESSSDASSSSAPALRDDASNGQQTDSIHRAEDEIPTTWSVGDVLLGVYEVCPLTDATPYAEGGMGLVHRVRHRGWNMDLAVKSPKEETFLSEMGKESFERECETWIELGMHPNIVTCYLVRRLGGVPRVFAEFVEDGSLRDWIRDKRLYHGGPDETLRRIFDIAIQFAWGLDHAHRHGVIHLDVKPANVMMQGDVAKVTDFGLARAQFAAVKRGGQTVRVPNGNGDGEEGVRWEGMTPAFCSPEQRTASQQHADRVSGDEQIKITRATDVWSWALSVLTMFHGNPPCRKGGHTADRVFEVYMEKENGREDRAPIPPSLAELMRRCFRVSPEERPGDMSEIADELIAIHADVFGESYARSKPIVTESTVDNLNNRAASLLDLGKIAQARRLLDEAWELRAWKPRPTYNRAMLAWRTGHMTDLDAVLHLQELCKASPQDPDALYALGLVRLERGDVKGAVESLEEAIARIHKAEGHDEARRRAELKEISQSHQFALAAENDAPRCVVAFAAGDPIVGEAKAPPIGFVSDNAKLLLFPGPERTLVVRDSNTGRVRYTFLPPEAKRSGASLSADLRHELTPVENGWGLEIRDVQTDKTLHRLSPLEWGRTESTTSLDGRLRFDVQADHTIVVADVDGRRKQRVLRGHNGAVTAAVFSDDGRFLVSGGADLTVRIWETNTGRCLRTLRGHNHSIDGVYIARNGQWILSVSGQRGLRIWNVALLCGQRRPYAAPLLLNRVTSSEETARSQGRLAELLAEAKEHAAKERIAEALEKLREARAVEGFDAARKSFSVWRTAGRFGVRSELIDAWCVRTIDSDGGAVRAAALSHDGRMIVSGGWDCKLRLWHVTTGRCLRTLAGHSDWIRSVAFTADDRRIVSVSWDRSLRVWDVATGECIDAFLDHPKQIDTLGLALGGRIAASAGWDGAVRLWNLANHAALRAIDAHEGYALAVQLSPDAKCVVSGGEDHLVKSWNAATGELLREFKGHTKKVADVDVRADRSMVASGSYDTTVRLWSIASGECVHVLEGHTGPVTAVRFTADGRWVLSGSRDRTMRMWNVASGECVRVLEGHSDTIACVRLSDDARWAISGAEDETVRLWKLDWDFTFPGWTEWDEAARPHLETFLALHDGDVLGDAPPTWTDEEFDALLEDLRHRGLGYIRPHGVLKELKAMAASWRNA